MSAKKFVTPQSVIDRYNEEQMRIMSSTKDEIRRISEMLDWTGDVEELMLNREAIASVTTDIVRKYGSAAAANASELFEAMDEAYTGKFKLAAMDAETVYADINASVHFAAGSLFPGDGSPPDVESFISRVCESAVKSVNRQAMNTMAANAGKDTKFRRITNGENVCPLCDELASRGYVWDVDELIEPHDGCMCSLIPGFGDDPEIEADGNIYPDLDDIF